MRSLRLETAKRALRCYDLFENRDVQGRPPPPGITDRRNGASLRRFVGINRGHEPMPDATTIDTPNSAKIVDKAPKDFANQR